MKTSALLPASVLALASFAVPQATRGHMPTPPPSMNTPDASSPENSSVTLSKRIDLMKLQQDADDLARTAETIPVDVASVRQGKLPKDVIQKLKQIEKLSKRLRGQLTP